MVRASVEAATRGLTLAGLVIPLASCGIARAWAPTDEQVLQRILPSAVQVVLEQREGRRFRTASGVIIATRPTPTGTACFVLTAGHTFSGAARGKEVYVILGFHQGRAAKVQAALLAERETDDLDLALLRAESDRCTPAIVGRTPILGEWAWVVAFPWGSRLTVARGVVSQLDESDSRLMVDASVSYGASGAGVYEARTGSLIGVVEGYGTARVSSQGGGAGWYFDVPVPGQTLVVSLRDIGRFLEDTGHTDLLQASFRR